MKNDPANLPKMPTCVAAPGSILGGIVRAAMLDTGLGLAARLAPARRFRVNTLLVCRTCGNPIPCETHPTARRYAKYCSLVCFRQYVGAKPPTRKQVRHWAETQVLVALRNGVLKQGPCEVCASRDSHSHHDDYSKPLEVRWLCRLHHNRFHHAGKPESEKTRQRIRAGLRRFFAKRRVA